MASERGVNLTAEMSAPGSCTGSSEATLRSEPSLAPAWLGRTGLALALLLGSGLTAGGLYLAGWLTPPAAAPVSGKGNDPGANGRGWACLGYVDLPNGVTSLVPAQAGVVKEVLVKESESVKAGAELVRLDDRTYRLRVAEARAALAAARTGLQQAEETRALHQGQIRQQRAAQEAARFRLSAARNLLDQKVRLRDLNLAAASDVPVAEEQVKELEALERVEQARLTELQARDVQLAISRGQAEVDAAQARLDLALQAQQDCVLRAPRDGTVLRLLVGPGDFIGGATRQAALVLAASVPVLVRAEVDQEFAGRVAEKQNATILNEFDPAERWTGTVTSVSRWFSQRRVTAPEPNATGSSLVLECIVTLDPTPNPPRINQRVRVLISP
jgi:multidrug resistance efflux pump